MHLHKEKLVCKDLEVLSMQGSKVRNPEFNSFVLKHVQRIVTNCVVAFMMQCSPF